MPWFQIETEIFNIVGVLTSLRHCQLGVENLDKLVIIMKNWSSDARVDCMHKGKSLDNFLANKANIINDNDIILI
jgi:nitrate reductase NapAB chaperone NapD